VRGRNSFLYIFAMKEMRMKVAIRSSETSVLARATRYNNPEDDILHSHCRENLRIRCSGGHLPKFVDMFCFSLKSDKIDGGGGGGDERPLRFVCESPSRHRSERGPHNRYGPEFLSCWVVAWPEIGAVVILKNAVFRDVNAS
jgi:hypothetical protein